MGDGKIRHLNLSGELDPKIINGEIQTERTLPSGQDLVLPAKDFDAQVYEASLLERINREKDFKTLLKIQFMTSLSETNPQMSADDITKAGNQFEKGFEAWEKKASDGKYSGMDESIYLASAMGDIVGGIPDPEMKIYAAGMKAVGKTLEVGQRYYNKFTSEDRRVEGQAEFYNTVQFSSSQREQIIRDFRLAQQNSGPLKIAANNTIGITYDISLDQDARTILSHDPELARNFVLGEIEKQAHLANDQMRDMKKFLIDRIGPNGDLTIKVDDLYRLSEKNFGIIKYQLSNQMGAIKKIGQKQDVMFKFMVSQAAKAEEKERARIRAQEEQYVESTIIAGTRGTVKLLGAVIGGSNPQLARQVVDISNNVINIVETLGQFKRSMEALETFDKARKGLDAAKVMSTALMCTNLVTAGMAIFSAFQSNSGPSADEIIIKQLAEVAKQLGTLRQEMHERFDRVDKQLNTIYSQMIDGFNTVLKVATQIRYDLQEIKQDLALINDRLIEMENKLNLVDQRIGMLGRDLMGNLKDETITDCLDIHFLIPSSKISDSTLLSCIMDFYRLASLTAQKDTLTNNVALPVTNKGINYAEATIQLSEPTSRNLRFLAKIFQLPEFSTPGTLATNVAVLPNSQFWREGVYGYHDVLAVWADPARNVQINKEQMAKQLARPGQNALQFMRALQKRDLLDKVLSYYDSALKQAIGSRQGLGKLWTDSVNTVLREELRPAGEFDSMGQSGIRKCGLAPDDNSFPVIPLSEAKRKTILEEFKYMRKIQTGKVELCYLTSVFQVGYREARTVNGECLRERRVGSNCREVDCYTECIEYKQIFLPRMCLAGGRVRVIVQQTDAQGIVRFASGQSTFSIGDFNSNTWFELESPGAEKDCVGNDDSPQLSQWIGGHLGEYTANIEKDTRWNGMGNSATMEIARRSTEIYNRIYFEFERRLSETIEGGGDPEVRESLLKLDFAFGVVEAMMRASFLYSTLTNEGLRASIYGQNHLANSRLLATQMLAEIRYNKHLNGLVSRDPNPPHGRKAHVTKYAIGPQEPQLTLMKVASGAEHLAVFDTALESILNTQSQFVKEMNLGLEEMAKTEPLQVERVLKEIELLSR